MRLWFHKTVAEAGVSPAGGAMVTSDTTTLPRNSHLAIVTDLGSFTDMESQWKALERRCKTPVTAFQSFDWVHAWASVYVKAGAAQGLLVIAGYTDGELVFVWPMMRLRAHGLNTLVWLSEPSGQYGDILLHQDHVASSWMPAALTLAGKMKDIDIVRLRHSRSTSNAANFLFRTFKSGAHTERAPYLDLTLFKSEQAYDARYTSNQRKRRKKIRKHLEELGRLEFSVLPAGTGNDRAMEHAIREKSDWLTERGRVNRIMRCPLHLEFLKQLSRRRDSAVQLVTSELTAAGKPVSWEIGFRFQNTHFAYITSHVTSLTDLSPGRLHMDMSQRRALADGMAQFDLMLPNDPHKESWASDAIETRDVYLPLTTKGHLYGALYIQTVRPLLRKAYYSAPPSWLAFLRRCFRY